jgi:hypothetical protein
LTHWRKVICEEGVTTLLVVTIDAAHHGWRHLRNDHDVQKGCTPTNSRLLKKELSALGGDGRRAWHSSTSPKILCAFF